MLKEIIISLTDNFHDLGHGGSVVDHMMDAVSGRGHRLVWGHDSQGLINAFELDGIHGVGEWFDHMAKDFTTIDGIPLPFAEAIRQITGMDTTDAIDWLTINAADVVEVGAEVVLLKKFFAQNPTAYHLSLLVGTALGFIDDNPLLLAYNTLIYLKILKGNGRMPLVFDRSAMFLNRCAGFLARVAMGIAAVDFGLGEPGARHLTY